MNYCIILLKRIQICAHVICVETLTNAFDFLDTQNCFKRLFLFVSFHGCIERAWKRLRRTKLIFRRFWIFFHRIILLNTHIGFKRFRLLLRSIRSNFSLNDKFSKPASSQSSLSSLFFFFMRSFLMGIGTLLFTSFLLLKLAPLTSTLVDDFLRAKPAFPPPCVASIPNANQEEKVQPFALV